MRWMWRPGRATDLIPELIPGRILSQSRLAHERASTPGHGTADRGVARLSSLEGRGCVMRARYLWVVLLALVFPVGLAACSSGALSSATTAPATTAAAPALNGAFNNVGISDDANPAVGNLDGGGYSYSAQALAAADLTPGASVAHDGLTFTLPDVAARAPGH